MVFPLIPVALGLASLGTAAWGAIKGWNAKENRDKARSALEEAQDEFNENKDIVSQKRDQTNAALESLGKLRLEIDGILLKRFVDTVSHVHNVAHKPILVGDASVHTELPFLEAIRISSYQASDLLKDGMVAIPSGVLAGLGAAGTVSAFGAASTGTVITSLSGVAATNATLAWLGGGSLATGGLGMAGGAAVLGGVVAGPILGVIGLVTASRMEKEATAFLEKESEYRIATEQLSNAVVVMDGINNRIAEISTAITALAQRLEPALEVVAQKISDKKEQLDCLLKEVAHMKEIAQNRKWWVKLIRFLTFKKDDFSYSDPLDFNNFSQNDKNIYLMASALAYPLYALLKVPVLEDDGSLHLDSERIIAETNAILGVEQ